jgi:HlyD family secretion protein
MRRITVTVIVVAAGLAIGTGVWSSWPRGDKAPAFRSTPVKRGDLVATITATGVIEPVAVVQIGAQVAGIVIAFGKDRHGNEIHWGSEVEKGMVLAKIDDSLYVAAVKTAEGQLKQAEAAVLVARANVLQQKANVVLATQNWERAKKLGPSDALSQSAYDQYKDTYEVTRANLASAEAAVEQAVATVAQNKAALLTAQINFNYCTIKSPVKGVLIDRQVNIGQTVVSSLSAPSLFLIANDLKHIQAWVSVNEADVGHIVEGQHVTFTVDAFPGRTFQGVVGQVRLNATMTQNVVTYTIAVDVDNRDGKLLPYLTANAQFEIGRRKGVLLVPNAALRFTPRPGEIVPEARQTSKEGASRRVRGAEGSEKPTLVWVEQGRFVRPVPVTAGLTDGAFTEVEGAGLTEGVRVAVGANGSQPAAAQTEERNPFQPQMPFRTRQPQAQGQGQEAGQRGQAGTGGGR